MKLQNENNHLKQELNDYKLAFNSQKIEIEELKPKING